MTQTELATMPLALADSRTAETSSGADRRRLLDRRVTLEHVASHIAHQLGTPLNVIEGRAAMLAANGCSGADTQRNARIIAEQSARMARILRELMSFCRRGSADPTEVHLAELTRVAVSLFADTARDRRASIVIHADSDCSVLGDPDELLVAVTHLVDNGLRFTPPDGTLHVRLHCLADAENDNWRGPECCIEVADEGPGISPELMPDIFKPFAMTDGSRDTLGLGLFIAHSVAKEHGGWLEAVDRAGAGARFTLHLPRGPGHVD